MSALKQYPSQSVAQKIATKSSEKDGFTRTVSQNAAGKWIIIVEQPAPVEDVAPTTTQTMVLPGFGEVEVPVTQGAVTSPEAPQKVNASQIVTVEIAGAKLTAQYVITPTLGDRPRWFERKRLEMSEAIEGGARITCKVSELTSRKLGHLITALDDKANAPETAPEQPSEAQAAA